MEGNSIVIWFSVIVFFCVFVWALFMIKAYNKTTKD